jgi:hypothetical protein
VNTRMALWVTVLVYATATLLVADTFVKYPRIRADLATFYALGIVMPYVASKAPLSHANLGGILLLVAVRVIRVALRI